MSTGRLNQLWGSESQATAVLTLWWGTSIIGVYHSRGMIFDVARLLMRDEQYSSEYSVEKFKFLFIASMQPVAT